MTPTEETNLKLTKLAAFLDRHKLDAVLLTRRANFSWLSGGCVNHVGQGSEVGAATLVATRDGVRCVASTIESPRMRTEELRERGIEVFEFPWYDSAAAAKIWADVIAGRKMATDASLPGLPRGVAAMPSGFDQLRWQLCEAEMRRYRAVGAAVGAGLQEVCRQIRPGQTEFEVGAALAARMNRDGIRTPVVLIAADERIDRYRHPIPTDRKIEARVMVVVAAERHGLYCSATRIVSFAPLSPDLRRRHDAVVRVDAALFAETRPGRTLGQLFVTAQRAYAGAGFGDEWKRHHQGGPTGYAGREAKAVPGSSTPVLSSQAFAWNPSIAGTKSEDTILVTDAATEILTQAVDWPVIEVQFNGTTWPRPDILTAR